MKYNPLIILCVISCVFFQIAPMLAVLLSPEISSRINFVEDPFIYFFLLIGAISLTTITYLFVRKRVSITTDIFDAYNKYQPYFWKVGEYISYFFFIPALIVSIIAYVRIMQIGYGDVEPTTAIESVILYAHLMGISFLFAGYDNSISKRRLLLPFALIIFPRFLISVSGPRVFVFQALVPCFFFLYPILKSFIRKHLISIILGVILLSLLPYMIGNRVGGELNWVTIYVFGSPVLYLIHSPLKNFEHLHLVFAGVVYSLFSTDIFGYKKIFDLGSYKVRLDWIFTRLTIGPEGEHHMGAGGNPIFEAYTEGIIGFVLLFILLGFICSYFDFRKKSMFNRFAFPHIIAKIGFLWRGTFVELIDRTFTYFFIFIVCYCAFIIWKNKKFAV